MQAMLSTAQVAELLETSQRMVHHYIARKKEPRLTPDVTVGRIHFFTQETVEAFRPKIVRRNWSHQNRGAA